MIDLKVTTAVASELLSVSNDIKPHLRITHTDDDTYLTFLGKAVREDFEKWLNRGIGEQQVTLIADLTGEDEYQLPYAPISSLVAYEKTDFNTYEAITAYSDYDLDGQDDKTFTPMWSGRFKLVYTCGYTSLPHGLKLAMLNECAYRYDNRGNEQTPGLSEQAMELAKPYKLFSWL